jgi:sigma-B regulation protein RsbU (phosphoserine phosphatase)
MAERDTHSQRDDDELLNRSERNVRAAGARKRAMERRAQAAEYRMSAAHDRRLAEQDREQAALERRRASVDREALAAGRTAFFQGDVCGKGHEAAAVTSLARYTMRAAAMLREQPDAILRDLNATLRDRSRETMQLCTAVCGEVAVAGGDAVVTLAVAGHPAVDEQRVAGLLFGVPQASAQTLVDRIAHALRGVDRPLRDDVAVLALQRTAG